MAPIGGRNRYADQRRSQWQSCPAEGTQARRFGKTRSAQSTALLEDYVELIADLLAGEGEARPTDIARRLGVSHATAIKTISRLKRAGLATARPYRGVFLTEKGQALADRVRVRHRLVVDLLRALGVPTRSRRSRRRGHRAPRLGNHAEGVRAVSESARVITRPFAEGPNPLTLSLSPPGRGNAAARVLKTVLRTPDRVTILRRCGPRTPPSPRQGRGMG